MWKFVWCAFLFLRLFLHGQGELQQYFEREFEDLDWIIPIQPEITSAFAMSPRPLTFFHLSKEDALKRLQEDIPITVEGDKVHLVQDTFFAELTWLISLQDQQNIWDAEIEALAIQKAKSLIRVYSRLTHVKKSSGRTLHQTENPRLFNEAQGIHHQALDIHALQLLALFEAKYWKEMHLLEAPYAFYSEAYELADSLTELASKERLLQEKRIVLEGLNEIFWGPASTWVKWTSGAHHKKPIHHTLDGQTQRSPSLWRDTPLTMGMHLEVSPAVMFDLPIDVPQKYRPKMLDTLQLAHLTWIVASDPRLPNNDEMKLAIIDAIMQSLHTYGTNRPSCKHGTENRLALSLQYLHPLVASLNQPWTAAQFWAHFPAVIDAKITSHLSRALGQDWYARYDSDAVWHHTSEVIAQALTQSLNFLPIETAMQFLLELDANGRLAIIEYISSQENE